MVVARFAPLRRYISTLFYDRSFSNLSTLSGDLVVQDQVLVQVARERSVQDSLRSITILRLGHNLSDRTLTWQLVAINSSLNVLRHTSDHYFVELVCPLRVVAEFAMHLVLVLD